ncbi:hypothetical protein [Mesorhizobium sp. WSM4303]|uniref:non-homologous end-joining DNA ligase LigD n=1 Tax=Mesorhizobium sp. WSM4303 TaxID=2589887 RepID=UPI0032B2A8D4
MPIPTATCCQPIQRLEKAVFSLTSTQRAGNTAVGAFSPRARPRFPIAHPVTWKQVEAGIWPDAFTLVQLFRAAQTKTA